MQEEKPKYKRPRTEAQRAGEARYKAKMTKNITLTLNRATDADIIAYLERCKLEGESVQGVIKSSLRYAMRSTCID